MRDELDFDVTLRRSARAKRISLRVSSLDGQVTLTMPNHVSERVAYDFLEEKRDWIDRARQSCAAPVLVAPGQDIPVEGILRRIVPGRGKSAKLYAAAIEAPEGREGVAVEALLKQMARDRLDAACRHYAAEVDRQIARLTLRDTRSRWGSCTETGNLMFSWRLILAPPAVLDYVAAHEVAHLVHMDHSKAFWAQVAVLCPDYDAQRAWLRREGMALHRYRFRVD